MSTSDFPPLDSSDSPFDSPDSPFKAARTARDEGPQFVLPLVVHLEKSAPPDRTDALETAARAVLELLSDPRSLPAEGEGSGDEGDEGRDGGGEESGDGSQGDGVWAAAVRDWQDARIRKVVRRARGAEWRRTQELPGITLTGKSAEVRVFPPIPVDAWPKDLAKLQVSGTELADPEPPAAPDSGLPVLWLSPDVTMSAGKAMAQAGHAAQLAWWELTAAERTEWRAAGFALAVRTATPKQWRELVDSGLPVVQDAGFTEVAPGSCTAVAEHPALRRRLDALSR